MPVRNIITIGLAIIVCTASYSISVRNRYASILSEALQIVDRQALVQIPQRDLFNAAMDGMLSRLDENSFFVSQEEFPAFEEDLNQEFIGVGMHFEVDPDNQGIRVISPIPGKPAWQAGIRTNDLITKIDGYPTADMDSDEAVRRIRGPVGTPVVFSIRRGEDNDFEVQVVREEIPIESVMGDKRDSSGQWNYVLEQYPRIGYIRLAEFGRKSSDEMRLALASIDGRIGALILDLRDNPGGLLTAAVEISDMFVGREVLVVETRRRDNTVTSQEFANSRTEIDNRLPMVILVNDNSASAAEIVAACLQDHDRALIAGTRTYGKGTVQDLIQLEANRSILRLTTASYWRPSGRNIDRTVLIPPTPGQYGVTPDAGFAVRMSDEQSATVRQLRSLRDLAAPATGEDADGEEHARWLEEDLPMQRALEHLLPLSRPRPAA